MTARPAVSVTVRLVSIDVGCSACGGSLREVPTEIGAVWLQGHHRPDLLALHLLVNDRPTTWVRRAS